MIKIIAPNKNYDGISAGVKFSKGVGECADPYLIEWFKEKGYEVEGEEAAQDPDGSGEGSELEKMTVEELEAYAKEHGINLGRSTSHEGILKKIQEAAEEKSE